MVQFIGTKPLTHVVIKQADIEKLPLSLMDDLTHILHLIGDNRESQGKPRNATYHVCNTDEPYAKEVLNVILRGEGKTTTGEPVPCQCGQQVHVMNTGFLNINAFQVVCQKCGAMGPRNPTDTQKAKDDWNRMRGCGSDNLDPQVVTRCFLCGKDTPMGDTVEVEQMLLCKDCATPDESWTAYRDKQLFVQMVGRGKRVPLDELKPFADTE